MESARRPGGRSAAELDGRAEASRLVRAAQAGDRSAFGELYGRYAAMVHAIARASLPADEAADVVQEAFYRALKQLPALRHADAFGIWLGTIARNVVRDEQRRRSGLLPNDEEPSKAGTQHDEMEAQAALRALRSLPTAYRDTMTMRLLNGMTGPEIAARTGLSAGSVRVNLHRGMKLLRERLDAATSKKAG